MSVDKSIMNAANKDYKAFEKNIADKMTDKMKEKLSGFMGHLEKNMFNSDKEE